MLETSDRDVYHLAMLAVRNGYYPEACAFLMVADAYQIAR